MRSGELLLQTRIEPRISRIQVQTPGASCREAARKVMAFARRKFPHDKGIPMSPDTSAYCQARAKIPLEAMYQINTHLVSVNRTGQYKHLLYSRINEIVETINETALLRPQSISCSGTPGPCAGREGVEWGRREVRLRASGSLRARLEHGLPASFCATRSGSDRRRKAWIAGFLSSHFGMRVPFR